MEQEKFRNKRMWACYIQCKSWDVPTCVMLCMLYPEGCSMLHEVKHVVKLIY